MTHRKSYDIIRIPSNDWDNLAETVSLDESYSEEIKSEIWSALENVKFFVRSLGCSSNHRWAFRKSQFVSK